MVERKLLKAIDSINSAIENYINNDKLASKGDLDYAKENIEESIYLILAQLEDDGINL